MYEYLTKPIQKQEKDKKAASQFHVVFADQTEENTDKQNTKFSFSKVRYNPRESSQTKTHAYLQSSHNTPTFSGGAKPVNNAGAAGNIVQCLRIRTSVHYRDGEHAGAKTVLENVDDEQGISNKLYNKGKWNYGRKHVAFFKLQVDGHHAAPVTTECIVVVFFVNRGETIYDEDTLKYHTTYYTTHASRVEPGAISWHPDEPVKLTQDQYDRVRGL